MDIRMNAGYTITDSIHIGNVEFVLGVSSTEQSMYVTWECRGGNNYYWGHYTSDLMDAKADLLDRAGQELEYQKMRQGRPVQGPQETNKERER